MSERYTVSNFLKALRNPSKLVREIERIYSSQVFERRHGEGVDVMGEDWDNLLILDACRADTFSKYNQITGTLKQVVSKSNESRGFIDGNFADKKLHDTIYVTANPFVERLSDDVFFKVYYSELFDKWNESLKTIPPSAVVDATLEMNRQYPEKRIIAHFMQPHAPYIGPTGEELYERYEFGVFNPNVKDRSGFDIPDRNIPQAVQDGPIQEHELKQAYDENVQIVLEHVEELVDELDGKSVITADHGEMLGERVLFKKRYGHGGIHTSTLRVVPWLVVDTDRRRKVTAEEPREFEKLDEREAHLEALGYI